MTATLTTLIGFFILTECGPEIISTHNSFEECGKMLDMNMFDAKCEEVEE